MSSPNLPIEALLAEERAFEPTAGLREHANISDPGVYEKANKDPEGFWAEAARSLDWFKPWDKVLEWNPPIAKWFIGGKLNVSYNCLDRHVKTWRRNKAALIWEGEPREERVLTYADLYREVNKFANVMKKLGIRKGDRVTIYMPMVPELPIALLACARIGAPHSVVFGGFSSESLRDRINDAQSKLVITADGSYRRGQIVPLKRNVDAAVKDCPCVENVILLKRLGDAASIHVQEGRDHWWHRLMADAEAYCEPEAMDAEDPLFILYTS
ncbi:MAG TPA: AMP-binding protein, partial [Terriglobia bacterium]|nr:AMP-binding protein [Terriglobia bacterium]